MKKLRVLFVIAMSLLASGQPSNPQAAGVTSLGIRKLAIDASGLGWLQSHILVIASPNAKPKLLVDGIDPAWSPDGQKIAYCVREGTAFGQIQLINADGSGHIQLTKLKLGGCNPDWSPDGEKIAFTSGGRIFVMGKNGENPTEIVSGYGARWSPDGKQLVFCREPESRGKSGSIWIANADGTGATRVIEDDSDVLEAAWFPDGKSLVFSSTRADKHKSAVFRVNLNGTALETLAVHNQFSLFFPVLSPDGHQLVADAIGSGETNVLLLDLASHHARVLAHGLHPSVLWEKR